MKRASRLEIARWEARRHADALRGALGEWDALAPRPWPAIESDKSLVRLLDQIVYRFQKLQDCVGERLVPATLEFLAEPFDDRPMRDRLDRLERLGFLDVVEWLDWRAVRNRLAHEYPDADEMRRAALTDALAASHELIACVDAWLATVPDASNRAADS